MDKNRKKAYLLLVITSIVWGAAAVVIKYTLDYISPVNFLFWRFLITSWILLPFFVYQLRKHPLTLKEFLTISVWGALGTTVSLILLFEGYRLTTAIDAVLIAVIGPLFIISGGALFLGEKIEKHEKIGVAIAFVGTIITIIQPLLEGISLAVESLLGNILVLTSTIVGTAYILLAKNAFKRHSPFTVTSITFFAGLITILPFFYFKSLAGETSILPESSAWFGIIYMVIFASLIGYFFRNKALEYIEASEVAVFSYLQPLVAIPLSFIFLKEAITIPFLIGAGIITVGVSIAEFAKKRKEKIA